MHWPVSALQASVRSWATQPRAAAPIRFLRALETSRPRNPHPAGSEGRGNTASQTGEASPICSTSTITSCRKGFPNMIVPLPCRRSDPFRPGGGLAWVRIPLCPPLNCSLLPRNHRNDRPLHWQDHVGYIRAAAGHNPQSHPRGQAYRAGPDERELPRQFRPRHARRLVRVHEKGKLRIEAHQPEPAHKGAVASHQPGFDPGGSGKFSPRMRCRAVASHQVGFDPGGPRRISRFNRLPLWGAGGDAGRTYFLVRAYGSGKVTRAGKSLSSNRLLPESRVPWPHGLQMVAQRRAAHLFLLLFVGFLDLFAQKQGSTDGELASHIPQPEQPSASTRGCPTL